MTTRLDDYFADLRSRNKRALAPFVCAGDPLAPELPDLLAALETGGAGMAEIGFPFSDPIADGPVIASAMERALAAGCTPERVFEAVAAARRRTAMPLIAMASVTLIWRIGVGVFLRRAADAGFDGVIVPDLPLEEFEANAAFRDADIPVILLIAPTTPDDRAGRIAQASQAMVYLVARAGITGASAGVPDIEARVAKIRNVTDRPIACGFGISTAEHVAQVVQHADAAIVGSALVGLLARTAQDSVTPADPCIAQSFVELLAAGLT